MYSLLYHIFQSGCRKFSVYLCDLKVSIFKFTNHTHTTYWMESFKRMLVNISSVCRTACGSFSLFIINIFLTLRIKENAMQPSSVLCFLHFCLRLFFWLFVACIRIHNQLTSKTNRRVKNDKTAWKYAFSYLNVKKSKIVTIMSTCDTFVLKMMYTCMRQVKKKIGKS